MFAEEKLITCYEERYVLNEVLFALKVIVITRFMGNEYYDPRSMCSRFQRYNNIQQLQQLSLKIQWMNLKGTSGARLIGAHNNLPRFTIAICKGEGISLLFCDSDDYRSLVLQNARLGFPLFLQSLGFIASFTVWSSLKSRRLCMDVYHVAIRHHCVGSMMHKGLAFDWYSLWSVVNNSIFRG